MSDRLLAIAQCHREMVPRWKRNSTCSVKIGRIPTCRLITATQNDSNQTNHGRGCTVVSVNIEIIYVYTFSPDNEKGILLKIDSEENPE